jgi:hypothetical protein
MKHADLSKKFALALALTVGGAVAAGTCAGAAVHLGAPISVKVMPVASGQLVVTWGPGSGSAALTHVSYQVATNSSHTTVSPGCSTTQRLLVRSTTTWVQVRERALYAPEDAPSHWMSSVSRRVNAPTVATTTTAPTTGTTTVSGVTDTSTTVSATSGLTTIGWASSKGACSSASLETAAKKDLAAEIKVLASGNSAKPMTAVAVPYGQSSFVWSTGSDAASAASILAGTWKGVSQVQKAGSPPPGKGWSYGAATGWVTVPGYGSTGSERVLVAFVVFAK